MVEEDTQNHKMMDVKKCIYENSYNDGWLQTKSMKRTDIN